MAALDHWQRWHEAYGDPSSPLSRRLRVVQRRLADVLTAAPSGELRLVSMCAGRGLDVLGVLADHPRRGDVRGRLVELDAVLVADAEAAAARLDLAGIEVIRADAGDASGYEGAVPADIVLVCGVFGNVTDDDVHRTVDELPHVCAEGATVIWTRHRRPPDLTPNIRRWFGDAGFVEVAFDIESESFFSVGTAQLAVAGQPFRPRRRMFSFVGDGADAHR